MENQLILNADLVKWAILPLFIFIARVMDVSLGTIRVIFISKGMRLLAPLVGFFEVLIWLLAIGQIMKNLTNVGCYIAYAGGFAMGTFIGISIVEKLSIGMAHLRVITKEDPSDLVELLRYLDCGVTSIDAQGTTGRVKVVCSIIKRKNLHNIIGAIQKLNNKTFYTIEDVNCVSEGIFPVQQPWFKNCLQLMRANRKGK